ASSCITFSTCLYCSFVFRTGSPADLVIIRWNEELYICGDHCFVDCSNERFCIISHFLMFMCFCEFLLRTGITMASHQVYAFACVCPVVPIRHHYNQMVGFVIITVHFTAVGYIAQSATFRKHFFRRELKSVFD
uniref:7TM_GPCR_Srx domain-containing protein n=1 Tax=Ascaris lumbricoides TaxID=6252 RepID=A0A0M3IA75_ASCLU